MLIVIYKTILYLITWNYSPDITALQTLDHQIKNLLFSQYNYNPLSNQFQVKNSIDYFET